MKELFGIDKFNIIEDKENYYFFRALNMGDDKDIEEGIILDKSGKFERIRTDRARYEENNDGRVPKYNKDSKISLEQVYDHIKMQHRKDTNCISLSSNANVAINYGRQYYKDKYIIVKVPKNEFGQKVINAGQYMLEEIERKIDKYISSKGINSELVEILSKVEDSKTSSEIKKIIRKRYTAKAKLDKNKAKLRKDIAYKSPIARISNYKALNMEQNLQKNKIIAKLILMEETGGMQPIISHTNDNELLIKTVGNAFSSLELIHYGDIEKEEIIELPKEIVDIFALLQQVEGVNEKVVSGLKREVICFLNENKNYENKEFEILKNNNSYGIKNNISIEEMYELTDGRIYYGIANSVVRNMFYLAKSQLNARALSKLLNDITGNNPKYQEIIKNIENKGFWIEPNIITRRSNKGMKLSESLSLDLKGEETYLVDKIKQLSDEEQMQILENGGLSDVRNVMTSMFSKLQRKEKISKEEYYSDAIVSLEKRFESVMLPTKEGKTFISLSELIKHKDEKMLYIAPQKEILEQVKDYIIKYIHGSKNTVGRSKDEIIKDIFPNLEFSINKTTIDKFIDDIKKLKEAGVDVTNIKKRDTIKDLVYRSGVDIKKIERLGLRLDDNIGGRKSTISQVHRGIAEGVLPTGKQIEQLSDLGISLEKQEKDAIQEFIDTIKKLKGAGVDVDISNIQYNDTIETLAQRSKIDIEIIRESGLDPNNNIGSARNYIVQIYKGNRTHNLSDKQVKELLALGINKERKRRNITQEFIETIKKLKKVGVDINNIKFKDTIETLAKKSEVDTERIKELGLNIEDKIGNTKARLGKLYRGKDRGIPPTKEQVKELLDLGISLETKKKTGKEIAEASISAVKNIDMLYEEKITLSKLVEERIGKNAECRRT